MVVELNGKNLFEELLSDEIFTMKLFSLIKEHFKSIDSDTLNVWLKNILAEFVRIKELHGLASESDELYSSVKSILAELRNIAYKDILEFSEKTYNAELYQKFFNHNPFVTTKIDYNTIASLYTIILIEIFDTLKNAPEKVNINLDIYFTYQPPQLFKRISSQQSFFIYQPYLYTNDGVYNYCELNIHSINPDILIEIDNYSNILKELYLLGIDDGTIFGDIDNIAKSVLNSSGKLFKA